MIIDEDGTTSNTQRPIDIIKESDISRFVEDVVEESKNVPVIVDFFSSQSEASKKLSNTLEKLVSQLGGIIKLVKVNLDENRQLAAQLQVQTVPTVFGFKSGQPVDAFAGPQHESHVKAFIKRITGNVKAPIEEALEEAKALIEEGNYEKAYDIYNHILTQDNTDGSATGGIIRCLVAVGDTDQADSFMKNIDGALLNDAEVKSAISALELAKASASNGDLDLFRNKLALNKDDHQARFDLALCLYGSGQSKQALDELLEIIRVKKDWNDEAARKQMVKIFEALGANDPITVQARRDLSTVLFS